MKKKHIFFTLLLAAVLFLSFSGCELVEQEEKIGDVDYTVLCPDEVPKDLAEEIEKVRGKEFQLSYDDGEYLYIAKGYGTKKSSGYNILVKEMYLTEHALVLHTDIEGPKEGEDVVKKETMPYIVVKTELVDKQVLYE